MKILLSTLTLTILLGLSGCSPAPEKTSLKVSLSAAALGSAFSGGVYVEAKNLLTQKKVLRFLDTTDDTIILDLESGDYHFSAIGWDGTVHFEGNPYCAYLANVNVSGADVNLALDATMANCNAPIFGGFRQANLISCSDVQKHIVNGEADAYLQQGMDCYGDDFFPGSVSHFKINLAQVLQDGTVLPGLDSACYPVSNSKAATGVKLPMGSIDFSLRYAIKGYASAAECDANLAPTNLYLFPNGLQGHANGDLGMVISADATLPIDIWTHTNICEGTQLSSTNPVSVPGKQVGDPANYLLCSAGQFAKIANDLAGTYILGTDIDFGGSNTPIAGPFVGSLEGDRRVLRNGNNPLFDKIHVLNPDSRIHDFSIENFNIDINANGAGGYGILANQILRGGSATDARLEVSNISIDPLSLAKITDSNSTSPMYLGGLVGLVDLSLSELDRIYFRNIQSQAALDSNANPAYIMATGGIVGKAVGFTGNSNVYFESVKVGSDIAALNIRGGSRLGGLVGTASNISIHEGVFVNLQVKGASGLGGVVGEMFGTGTGSYSYVRGTSTKVSILANSAEVIGIGGVVGNVLSEHGLMIESTVSNLSLNDISSFYSSVGGMVGSAYYSSSMGGLSINNVKANIQNHVDGSSIGGFVGAYGNASFTANSGWPAFIKNSIAEGFIGTADPNVANTMNTQRAGFVGSITGGRVERSLANFSEISGDNLIGGGYGQATQSEIFESQLHIGALKANVDAGAGGIIGKQVDASVMGAYQAIKLITSCGSVLGTCKGLIGGFATASSDFVFSNIINLSGVSPECGINCSASLLDQSVITSDSNCGASPSNVLPPFEDYSLSGGKCELLFEHQWRKYGYDAASNRYLAGNSVEPFLISSMTDWNGIGTDALLMSKHFKLMNDLDFGSNAVNFNPIGANDSSVINPDTGQVEGVFRGGIQANGHVLRNITYDATAGTSAGLFPMLGGQLGHWGEPLIIENMVINCGAQLNCGTVGEAFEGANIHVVVRNGNVSSSAGVVGGLVGFVSGSWVEIADSGFEGSIIGVTDSIGGLVGQLNMGSTVSLNIRNSFAKLSKIVGGTNVAGLIGRSDGGQSVRIENSYVWLDVNQNNNTGADIQGTSTFGLVGLFSGSMDMRNVYVDYSKAQLPVSGFQAIIGAGAINSNNNVYMVGATNYDSYGIATGLVATQADLEMNMDSWDWVMNSSGELISRSEFCLTALLGDPECQYN